MAVRAADQSEWRNAFCTRINAWYLAEHRKLPWREPGFTPWGQLVAEFMLQQTQVDRVVPRLQLWLERWPTPADLAADSPAEAIRLWDRLGYPRRALWLHRAAVEIVERFGGEVPSSVDDLLTLTGVGPYTARAVAAFAFGDPVPVVDTNTRRVIARAVHGLASAGAPNERRDLTDMATLLPQEREAAATFNAAAMELGAVICTARAPKCETCPVSDLCAWMLAGAPQNAPARRAKQAKFEGSDRQARGQMMAHLREHGAAPTEALLALVPDAEQAERVLASLERDGLIERTHRGFALVGVELR